LSLSGWAALALAGDSAGYWIGRRWRPRLLSSLLGRRVGPARLHKVESLLLRGGGWAWFEGLISYPTGMVTSIVAVRPHHGILRPTAS
jgi:membrane protein DedA with SNARE-associated domain